MKQGYGVFGRAYETMLKNDLHNRKSIDYRFLQEMILLEPCSKDLLYSTVNFHDMTGHELFAFAQRFASADDKQTVKAVLSFTSGIALNYEVDFDKMLFGGSEKQILERGTDWCADMTRVGAVLLQCLGIPCRIVHLANLKKAYNGHVIGEAYYNGGYGLVDFIYGFQFYKDKKPASAYDVLCDKIFPEECDEDYKGLFSAIAINEYDPTDSKNDYTVSRPNEYCKRLIHEDHNGKWIMGEDK